MDAVRSTTRLLTYPLSSPVTRLAEVLAPVAEVATVCSACSSGANAIIEGAAWITSGRAERVLAGGADGLCRLTLTGFNSLGATDTGLCRPFDRNRAGLTLGEGAAFLVLEREEIALARGARILGWLSGFAVGAEAFHVTHPETSGSVAAGLLEAAMRRAGLGPEDVDYVNAHGTGTVPNDAIETLAIRRAFGAHADRVIVSSAKGQIGHTLGAAGAIEAAITVLALHHQVAPPTGGLTEPDDACKLRHVMGEGLRTPIRAALSNSFGFGGTGAVLLFERSDAKPRALSVQQRATAIVVTAIATIGPEGVLAGSSNAEYLKPAREGPPARIRTKLSELLDPAKSRRFDAQASLAAIGCGEVLRDGNLPPSGVGLVAGTAFGNVDRTVAFVQTAVRKGPRRAAPAEFPHLVPSAPSGNASIYHGLSGPVVATSDLGASAEAAFSLACDWIDANVGRSFIAGSAEPFDASVSAVLGPVCESEGALPRSEGAGFLLVESVEAARSRGVSVSAVVRARYQVPAGEFSTASIQPPVSGARALVVIAQSLGRIESLLSRSGWGAVQVRSVAERTGWHEGVGGFALAAAVALIMEKEVSEVLVVGHTSARAFLFHLTAPA
jgi:3-oxoacyl-[acyl-carrier-protein] synthase II